MDGAAGFEFTDADLALVVRLRSGRRPCSPSYLAARLGCPVLMVTRLLRLLEAEGAIDNRDPELQRARFLEAGRARLAAAAADVARRREHAERLRRVPRCEAEMRRLVDAAVVAGRVTVCPSVRVVSDARWGLGL